MSQRNSSKIRSPKRSGSPQSGSPPVGRRLSGRRPSSSDSHRFVTHHGSPSVGRRLSGLTLSDSSSSDSSSSPRPRSGLSLLDRRQSGLALSNSSSSSRHRSSENKSTNKKLFIPIGDTVFVPMIWDVDQVLTSCGAFESERRAINACIRGLVSRVGLLYRHETSSDYRGYGNVDEKGEDILDEKYTPSRAVLRNNDKFIEYLIEYVDCSMEKLVFLCELIGRHYKEEWNFRIDRIIIDDNNSIKSTNIKN